jgi:hypothetical protein
MRWSYQQRTARFSSAEGRAQFRRAPGPNCRVNCGDSSAPGDLHTNESAPDSIESRDARSNSPLQNCSRPTYGVICINAMTRS